LAISYNASGAYIGDLHLRRAVGGAVGTRYVIDKKLGTVDIAAGQHSQWFSIDDQFEVAAGTYRVTVLSASPTCEFEEEDITIQPGVIGWFSATIEVN
jgi:hypothetical protein